MLPTFAHLSFENNTLVFRKKQKKVSTYVSFHIETGIVGNTALGRQNSLRGITMIMWYVSYD